jgi:hypothetical protein
MPPPKKCRAYISFDYDYDQGLKNLLVGQSRLPASPFVMEDWSIKEETKGWKTDARRRIHRSDVVIVICGEHTDRAVGVTAEIEIAREEHVPYYLLRGHKTGRTRRPGGTSWLRDTIHPWDWDKLRSITTVKTRSRRTISRPSPRSSPQRHGRG